MKVTNDHPIVMVDDNPGDLELVSLALGDSTLDNPWLSFTNGPDFLNHLASVQRDDAKMPALVLLDINMPMMTGFEVVEQVRSDPFFAELPIFCMLTSSSAPRDRERAKAIGATGFLVKPTDFREYIEFFNGLR